MAAGEGVRVRQQSESMLERARGRTVGHDAALALGGTLDAVESLLALGEELGLAGSSLCATFFSCSVVGHGEQSGAG